MGIIQKSVIALFAVVFLSGFIGSGRLYAQQDRVVAALVQAGFENVSLYENDTVALYTIQNSAYKSQEVGVGKALDILSSFEELGNKRCKLVVLENNVPQIALERPVLKEAAQMGRALWSAGYDLGAEWKMAKGATRENSSLFKADIVVYPELLFQNYRLDRNYDIVANLNPTLEVSLWKGMKFTAQIIIPLYRDEVYNRIYGQVRPGYLSLTQSFRLPYRIFGQIVAGKFNNDRLGVDFRLRHWFYGNRFYVGGRVGYTTSSYFDQWKFYYGSKWRVTGEIEAGYYWKRYNTTFSVRGQRFLLKEYGVRLEMIRHLRYASIGFYINKLENAYLINNNGFNGGFLFQIALPPYKYKRRGYIPRVTTGEFPMRYNAGNEKYYGKAYMALPDDFAYTEFALHPNRCY